MDGRGRLDARVAQTVEAGAELSVGHVGEVVHGDVEVLVSGKKLSVVVEDELKVAGKNALSEDLFFKVGIASAESGLVIDNIKVYFN